MCCDYAFFYTHLFVNLGSIISFFHLLFFLFTYCYFILMLQKTCQMQSNSIFKMLKHMRPPFHFLTWIGCFLSLFHGLCPGSFFYTFSMLDSLFSCLLHMSVHMSSSHVCFHVFFTWLTPLQWFRTYSSNTSQEMVHDR